jgi:hypothetical protein
MAPWWRKKKDKKVTDEPSIPNTPNGDIIVSSNGNGVTFNPQGTILGNAGIQNSITGATGSTSWYNIANATSAVPSAGAIHQTTAMNSQYVFSSYKPTNIVSLIGDAGKEIVRLNLDGSVTWANEINVDEAAEAFARSLKISAELQAGINKAVKSAIRDQIFEEIIEIAKVNGKLTVDELTFMYESSKIMEKLRGGRE